MENKILKCEICGITCDKKIISNVHGIFMCSKHKAQYYRYGKITDVTQRTVQDKNEIIRYKDHAEIILRNKTNNKIEKALIDLEDVDKLSNYKWHYEQGYAISGRSNRIKMHRLVLDYNGELEVDHINRNKLDNRKENLRIVPRVINSQNVQTDKKHLTKSKSGKWVVKIQRFGIIYRLGTYENKDNALTVRNNFLAFIKEHESELTEKYEKNKINIKGIGFNGCGKFTATINMNGKIYYLGSFNSIEEAVAERNKKIEELKVS